MAYYGTFRPSGQTLADVESDLERVYRSRGTLTEFEPPTAGAKVKVRPVGLLIGRPECKVMKDEILPSIRYLHHRTGNDIDFFLLGYINPEDHKVKILLPDEEPVDGEIYIDSYDAQAFSTIVRQLEEETDWKYGGGTELIIMYSFASKLKKRFGMEEREEVDVGLDFSSAITMRLEQAIEAKMIPSAIHFIETVVRSAQNASGYDYLEDIRGHFVLREGRKGIIKAVASWLKIDVTSLENVASSQIADLRKNYKARPPFKYVFHRTGV